MHPPPPLPVRVVGVGASAGGLEAFLELLARLPTDTGMAFVLLSHLDPTHPSFLAEILGRRSHIPVDEVTEDRVRLLPDRVYVLAPNTFLHVVDGHLLRTTREDHVRGKRRECIDSFFSSLAASHGNRAVGVILSGSASDGSEGIRDIKEAGGVTFAQDSSAQFPDMPRSAAATGAVDHVLAPAAIAAELGRLARQPLGTAAVAEDGDARTDATADGDEGNADAQKELRSILRLLAGATRVDFSHYKQTTIRRRLARRMALRGIESIAGYLELLEDDPVEVRALHDDILIHVTCFFREPDSFELLRTTVFPALLRDRDPQEAVRVWVPGCSTGEEVYSLAIALLEYYEEVGVSPPTQFFGTDISERAIEKARAGLFSSSISREVSPERLRRYFRRVENRGGYQVAKAIRDLCVFARQDLVRDPPFSRIDLLSCRNVLIYLGPDLQRRVLPLFNYALRPGAFLLLGGSESVGPFGHLFEPVEKSRRLHTKIPTRQPIHFGSPPPSLPPLAHRNFSGGDDDEVALPFDVGREADRVLLAHHVPAAVVVDATGLILHVRGDTGPFLRTSSGKPSHNLLKMAREDLLVDLDRALSEARARGGSTKRAGILVRAEGRSHEVTIDVSLLHTDEQHERSFLVVFRAADATLGAEAGSPPPADGPEADRTQEDVGRLRQELLAARAYHQSMVERSDAVNEELRAAHEEVLSANEELQSTNEELETAKEELQASNEELATLNDELQYRNLELGTLNSDLENLLANVNLPLALVDGDMRLRRITPPAERLFNVLPIDIDRRLTDFKHNFVYQDLEQALVGVLETLSPLERDIQDRDGHWYTLRIRSYRSVDNRMEGAVLVLDDIHVMKMALLEAERARAFVDAVFDASPDPLLVLDAGLVVRAANRAFYRVFQARRPEIVGQELLTGQDAWDIPPLRSALHKVLRENARVDDLEVNTQGRVLVVGARRVGDQQGASVVLVVRDVTESRGVQMALRESERRLGAVFDHALTGIALLDTADRITLANTPLCAILRRPVEEVVGKRYRDFVLPAEARSTGEGPRRPREVMDGGALEQRLVRGDGSPVWVERDLSLVQDPLGRVEYGVLVVKDISERRRVEAELGELTAGLERRVAERTEALERTVRELNDFSYTVAHDLRSPLRGMAAFSQLLLKDYVDRPLDEKGRGYLQRISASAMRLDALVVNLLAYSRLGRIHITTEPVELGPLVSEALNHLADEVRRRDAQIVVGEGLPTVLANRVTLGQALENLLLNALVFTRKDVPPRVVVRWEPDGDGVRLWVEDNGIGIAPEHHARVFGVFERLHRAEEYPGTGIGLAIVRRAVERMGGTVGVESASDVGSRFWLRLPRVSPA